MKKILLGLSLIFILGCSAKTDENGFYIEGRNIGIHKETKTKYNKEGFDINGWNEKFINKETKTKYDKEGFDYFGFNKDKINKETGTNYDINGWDCSGFNEKGIHKITGFNFDEKGYTQKMSFYSTDIFINKFLERPYVVSLSSLSKDEKEYFKTDDDKFEGITYIGRSYYSDLPHIALAASTAMSSKKLAELTQNSEHYKEAYKAANNLLEMIKDKFFIDIVTNYSQDNKVKSYFIFTFFSPEKQYNLKAIELLVNGNIIKINDYFLNSNNLEMDFSYFSHKLPVYLNQVEVPITDNIFNLFAKMEKNQKIEVRILTDEADNRFTWTNKIEKDKGLAIGLGRHYKMLNTKNKDRKNIIF